MGIGSNRNERASNGVPCGSLLSTRFGGAAAVHRRVILERARADGGSGVHAMPSRLVVQHRLAQSHALRSGHVQRIAEHADVHRL